MNDLDTLVKLVERHPTNPIVAGMLTDVLMEERDMHRSEADEAVAKVQAVGKAATLIRVGAELLEDDTERRRWLIAQVRKHCSVPKRRRPTIMVTDGYEVKVALSDPDCDDVDYWGHAIILVGASWLLMTWDARLDVLCNRQRARRAALKKP